MNPFLLTGYRGPDTFCDRRDEIDRLVRASAGGVNVTMISLRRMGKSALVEHFFHRQRRRGIACVSVDCQPTRSVADLADAIASAMARDLYGRGTKIKASLADFVRAIGASLTFAADGTPSVTLKTGTPAERQRTIAVLLDEIERHEKPVIVAFDEFQQIASYPDDVAESLLRASIQRMARTRFVFAGSHRDMLAAMFADHRRPFYQSTEHLYLGPIPDEAYGAFVRERFGAVGRTVTDGALQTLHACSERRTFHQQQLAHRLYDGAATIVDATVVGDVWRQLLKEQEHLYYGFRNLLTPAQWSLLVAIAARGSVAEPQGQGFIRAYGLGAASTVRRSLSTLVAKELVYADGGAYRVEDPFLAGWLRLTFVR